MVKLVIFNELSNARNPNNMQVLHTVLQHSPEQAPKVKGYECFYSQLAINIDLLICITSVIHMINSCPCVSSVCSF